MIVEQIKSSIEALNTVSEEIVPSATFYEVFMKTLEEVIKDKSWIFITEKQLELVEDSNFLNDIPYDDKPLASIALILIFDNYNAAFNGRVAVATFPKSKHAMDTMKKHINTVNRFKKMLEDPYLVIPTPDDDLYERLKRDTEILAKGMEKAMLMKEGVSANKQEVREFIYEICDEFHIKKGADVKAFINTFDKED